MKTNKLNKILDNMKKSKFPQPNKYKSPRLNNLEDYQNKINKIILIILITNKITLKTNKITPKTNQINFKSHLLNLNQILS